MRGRHGRCHGATLEMRVRRGLPCSCMRMCATSHTPHHHRRCPSTRHCNSHDSQQQPVLAPGAAPAPTIGLRRSLGCDGRGRTYWALGGAAGAWRVYCQEPATGNWVRGSFVRLECGVPRPCQAAHTHKRPAAHNHPLTPSHACDLFHTQTHRASMRASSWWPCSPGWRLAASRARHHCWQPSAPCLGPTGPPSWSRAARQRQQQQQPSQACQSQAHPLASPTGLVLRAAATASVRPARRLALPAALQEQALAALQGQRQGASARARLACSQAGCCCRG